MSALHNIRNHQELSFFVDYATKGFEKGWSFEVAHRAKKDRSGDQNRLSFKWYQMAALGKGDITVLQARCQSKLHCGVPLLMTEDEGFREKWERMIKARFSYEEKTELMEWFPVSSLMSTAQFGSYLDRMQAYWEKQGVILLYPNEPPAQ